MNSPSEFRFSVISTFSGCGGSSLGYAMAGGKVCLAVEFDDNAVETYRLNFPWTAMFHGDIATLSVDQALDLAGLSPGELDVFDGSPPCQGFSTIGKRHMSDSRNQLFREYVRLLTGLQPRAFVMENVGGMVKGKMRLIFAECLTALRSAGFRVRARLLNAKYFNVPQSRPRLIFIGARNDLDIDPTFPKPNLNLISARQALVGVWNDPAELEWLRAAGAKYATYRHWEKSRPGQKSSDFEKGLTGFTGFKINPAKPVPTIAKFDANLGTFGPMMWHEKRRPTLAEFKRFASFPDDFQFSGTWQDGVQRIGNSVPPNFMRAIAEHIRDTILERSLNLSA